MRGQLGKLKVALVVLSLGSVLVSSGSIRAQDLPAAGGQTDEEGDYPGLDLSSPASPLRYETAQPRDALERRSTRSRHALIATASAAGLGGGMLFAAMSQCDEYLELYTLESAELYARSRTECNSAGKILISAGSPLLVGGFIGALTSGIMLGVRNRKLRKRRSAELAEHERRVRWDPRGSQIVF